MPASFDYAHHVSKIKTVPKTPHGRKGHLTEKVMYFAIRAPGREDEFWVQIDVKVCEEPSLFEWEKFCFNYSTASGLLGSMLKPVGLTLDQEGLHIRVEGLEKANWEKSFVFLTNTPKELLKIVGLDKRLIIGGFKENAERKLDLLVFVLSTWADMWIVFEYIAGSWIFNPAHFAERLKDSRFVKNLNDRAPTHVPFVKSWASEHFPDTRS
jgi:hypothetical protein